MDVSYGCFSPADTAKHRQVNSEFHLSMKHLKLDAPYFYPNFVAKQSLVFVLECSKPHGADVSRGYFSLHGFEKGASVLNFTEAFVNKHLGNWVSNAGFEMR